jgi:hypothetical protein
MYISMLDTTMPCQLVICTISPFKLVDIALGAVGLIFLLGMILVDRSVKSYENKKKIEKRNFLKDSINKEIEKRMKENKKN